MPNWKRTRLATLIMLGFTLPASNAHATTTCPQAGADNITIQLDNNSPPKRRQAIQPGDTIYWHQPDDFRHTNVVIVFDDPTVCDPETGPANGTCTINAKAQIDREYGYRYCAKNLATDPKSAGCTDHHYILVLPVANGFGGRADLEFDGADGKEISHYVRDVNTCVSWQKTDGHNGPTPITFNDPNHKPSDCTPGQGGLISCYVPRSFLGLRLASKDPYSICTAAGCTDPTIHILGTGDTSLVLDAHLISIIVTVALFGGGAGFYLMRVRNRSPKPETGKDIRV